MNAYVVTEGSYSDYRIVRVFLEKGLAEEYVRVRGEDYEVEEYEVTERIPEIRTLHTRIVEIHAATGEVLRDWAYSATYEPRHHGYADHQLQGKELHWWREEMPKTYYTGPRVQLRVVGINPERVKKVAEDRTAQERARIMGL